MDKSGLFIGETHPIDDHKRCKPFCNLFLLRGKVLFDPGKSLLHVFFCRDYPCGFSCGCASLLRFPEPVCLQRHEWKIQEFLPPLMRAWLQKQPAWKAPLQRKMSPLSQEGLLFQVIGHCFFPEHRTDYGFPFFSQPGNCKFFFSAFRKGHPKNSRNRAWGSLSSLFFLICGIPPGKRVQIHRQKMDISRCHPEIRPACPRVMGRIVFSFCLLSESSPGIWE